MIACACAIVSRVFLSYFSSSTVVQVPWLPDVTEGHVTPKGFSLSVRMRNRKLQNICPNGAFSPEMTSSPIGIPLGCSLGRPRPISSMATGTSPYHYLPLLFSYNNMRQVQPETLPKNSIFSSCLQNIKLKINTT